MFIAGATVIAVAPEERDVNISLLPSELKKEELSAINILLLRSKAGASKYIDAEIRESQTPKRLGNRWNFA